MISNHRAKFAFMILVLAILSCNVPGTAPSLSVEDSAATIIAQTLTAQPQEAVSVATATRKSAVTPTAATRATATKATPATITPTYSTPMLIVLESTNCREGPGENYPIVITYLEKKQLEIAGRYEPANFWLVKSTESKTGTCWLWGEYVELSGSYWVVPTLTPPATATLPPPTAPSVTWRFECSGNLTFVMEWEDRATNETGYRVFRDGEAITELPANSTSFTETIPIDAGEDATYYLQVFGPGGTANSSLMKATC